MSADIRGFSIPKKPVVRKDSEGYKVKVWYQNGSGPVLWMWLWYFASPSDTLEGALENARRVAR